MQVGDKIFCIKNNIDNSGVIIHRKGYYYTIMTVKKYNDDLDIYLYCEKTATSSGYYGYTFSGELINNFKLFSEYFISDIRKIRKLKINEINEINEDR